MRPVSPILAPDASDVTPVRLSSREAGERPLTGVRKRRYFWRGYVCKVCHEPLEGGERKAHVGACARTWKTELQRRRRHPGRGSAHDDGR